MALTPLNRQEEWYQQIINASTGKYLPSVSAQDAGKVLTVGDNGSWEADAIPKELPTVETTDKDKYLRTNASTGALEWVASDKQISATYSEIKSLRDGGNLVKGATYRMTDYVTKINGTYDLSTIGASGYVHVAKSAEHPFDLLLYAIDESHLSEIAKATWHDGDSYFADAKVNAWDIRYCIDNDTTRFAWADATNGKGVIYWMRDEWDNECGYDFKNVLTVRYALTADSGSSDSGLEYNAETSPNRYGSPYHVFLALREYMGTGTYNNPFADAHYDFSVGANILGTVQMPTLDSTYLETFQADLYYTFDYYDVDGNHNDATLNNASHVCRNNKIERSEDPLIQFAYGHTNTFGLDCICFESNGIETPSTWSIENNVIKNGCAYSTFGHNCCENSIGSSSYGNIFGSLFINNSMASNCYENIFSYSCQRNNFFARSHSNVFEYLFVDNKFLHDVDNNYFGGYFSNNTICGAMSDNVFGNHCTYNTFGQSIDGNTFGDYLYMNTVGDYFTGNTVESHFSQNTFNGNNQGVTFYRAAGGGEVFYYNIGNGVSNANLTLDLGKSYEQYIGYNSSGELVSWCPADLVH